MNALETVTRIGDAGVVAVLRAPEWKACVRAAEALVEGGVLGIEVAYTTPEAVRAIDALAGSLPAHAVLGAGTVTTAAQAYDAVGAGASFLVSPGTSAELATAMKATGVACMLGALTPSEILHVVGQGADLVKVFPAGLGGPAYISALRGPFPDVPFMPTGGVSLDNLSAWKKAGVTAVGAGSDLCPTNAMIEGDWATITARARVYCRSWREA